MMTSIISNVGTVREAALRYHRAGLCVLPARADQKRPTLSTWKSYRARLPIEPEVARWFTDAQAICILCGRVSGNVEMIDFDVGGELFDAWTQRIPPGLSGRLVIETTQNGGRHVVYRCESEVCGNMKLAQRRSGEKVITLIETRGEGGLFLCAPTLGYALVQGDLACPPVLTAAQRDAMLQAAWELNEYVPPVVDGPRVLANVGQVDASSAEQGPPSADISHNGHCRSDKPIVGQGTAMFDGQGHCSPENGPPCESPSDNPHDTSMSADRPGDDFNRRGDVRAVLERFGWLRIRGGENEYWRRPGKQSGTSATLKDGVFYVFSSNAAPFEPNRCYSPFAVYAWLTAGGDFEQAARCLGQLGYGADSLADTADGPDISAIVRMSDAAGHSPSDNAALGRTMASCGRESSCGSETADPGPLPAEILRVPGFISEVMDHTLATAPYPNQVMAFGGALALQAFLAGRKVRDPGDNRTNLYLLGLAHSSAGKDQSRKVNCDVIHAIGLGDCLGLHFASGEAIQDALHDTPTMLFQTDEIDGLLQSINKAKDARHEAIMGTMLTMYSSANSVYPLRRKAGKESPGVIDQPCLVVYGTAIPNHYYQALSERMLTNGFFARMIVLEAGPRPPGQEPSIHELPPRVLATAKWWADYRPGTGNLEDWHPVPAVVEHSEEAKRLLVETRLEAEAEYSKAEASCDSVGTTVWGRASEQVRKLALLYAISENHLSPHIGQAAVEWASQLVKHQTRRMLFMATAHVAENPFHAACLKLMEKLRNASSFELPHSVLLKRMKVDAKTFSTLVETLVQQGDIEVITVPRPGWHMRSYRLAQGVNHGGETSGEGER